MVLLYLDTIAPILLSLGSYKSAVVHSRCLPSVVPRDLHTNFKPPFISTPYSHFFANCYYHVIHPKFSGLAFLQHSPPSGSLQNYFTKSLISFSPQFTYSLVWVIGASPFLGQTLFFFLSLPVALPLALRKPHVQR
jgi:hypothetical protein